MNNRIRLASAPINWGISYPNEEGNPTPDEVMQSVVDAGYVGCEFGPYGYFGATDDEVAARFEKFGLQTVAIWLDLPLEKSLSSESITMLDGICSSLKALDAPYLIVSDLITDERTAIVARVEQFPDLWWSDDDWRQVRETFIQIGEIAGKHGRTVAVHPHMGGHIESGREIEQMLKAIDDTDIRVCIDTGHIRIGGVDAIPILANELHRVVHVHAKDINQAILGKLQRGEITLRDAVGSGLFCDLGKGMVDWNGFASILTNGGYQGWVVAEQDRLLTPGAREPFESNRHNHEFLKSLLNAG